MQTQQYQRSAVVVFCKTKETFGGLSNMAGFPLEVNQIRIRTSEALYQACRFPHRPEIQKAILDLASPMAAKMKSKSHRGDSRPDWDSVRIPIMWWALQIKLSQNRQRFGELLLSTQDLPIVEESQHDNFWGAVAQDGETLVGRNLLGRLLVKLRTRIRSDPDQFQSVPPLEIPNFSLMGSPIGVISSPSVEGILHSFSDQNRSP